MPPSDRIRKFDADVPLAVPSQENVEESILNIKYLRVYLIFLFLYPLQLRNFCFETFIIGPPDPLQVREIRSGIATRPCELSTPITISHDMTEYLNYQKVNKKNNKNRMNRGDEERQERGPNG